MEKEFKAKFTADNSDLSKKTKQSEKEVKGFTGQMKKFGAMVAAAFSVGVIINFAKEMVSLASKITGVELAFNLLNKPSLLDDLRTATRGTVTDLELMQKAVQAKNFKIPLDQLATYFEFATKRAIQTGESVDFLVNSIITGIGRKSVLVMDNLGISAVELQEEVKRVGDFGEASGNIIRRELESMGDVADTTATRMASLSASFTNLKTNLGKLISENRAFIGTIEVLNRYVDNTISRQNELNTILGEESISPWVKLGFKVLHFTKLGKKVIAGTAKTIEKQKELSKATEGTDTAVTTHKETVADHRLRIEELTASLETLTEGENDRAQSIYKEIDAEQAIIDKLLERKQVLEAIARVAPPEKADTSPLGMPDVAPDIDSSGLQAYAGALEGVTSAAQIAKEAMMEEKQAVMDSMFSYMSATEAASMFANQIISSSVTGADSMKDFASVAVATAKRVISSYIAEGVAAAVKSALKLPFPLNIVAAGIAGGAAAALFNAIVPDFAAGGAVSGPTLAMVGEASGISRSNPEYMGTAKQLGQMGIGGGGTLTARISRGDLLIMLNEAQSHNKRTY